MFMNILEKKSMPVKIRPAIGAILVLVCTSCFISGMESRSLNSSLGGGFGFGVATWYGDSTGPGSGGGCGFGNDIGSAPYDRWTAAGNRNLFKSGSGCGSCYQVKCSQHPECSGSPITVTITNECPGDCNNNPIHFDLSGKAFGGLAKTGQENTLRKYGIIDIQYQRVQCNHNANIVFKIDLGSNQNFLAFAIEDVNGDGDIGSVGIMPSGLGKWIPMKQTWGATWAAGIPAGAHGPYSVQITTIESRQSAVANNVIPTNWAPGQHYSSSTNVH